MTPFVLVLAACSGGEAVDAPPTTWLSGIYYRWVHFNHRVSYIHVAPNGSDSLDVSIIGGTSTTGVPRGDLADTCDLDSCIELPFFDEAEIRIGWGQLSEASVATGRADLEVGAAGGSMTIDIPLEGATGDVTALIRGITIDTDHALDGAPACYQPRYGWHPREIEASIDNVVLGTDVISVDVSASFAAGESLDEQRLCIDEVNDRAVVAFAVDVMAIANHTGVEDVAISSGATYPFSGYATDPGEQEEVAPQALDLTAPVVGWSAMSFSFNPDNTEGRGVYLRTFGFEVGPDGAAGLATNFSPITQLHDMSYTFDGVVRGVSVEGVVETGTVEATLSVDLEADETPVIHTLPLQ